MSTSKKYVELQLNYAPDGTVSNDGKITVPDSEAKSRAAELSELSAYHSVYVLFDNLIHFQYENGKMMKASHIEEAKSKGLNF